MKKLVNHLKTTIVILIVFCLAGCGGGGTSGTNAPVAMTVSGVASAGASIIGSVYLKDSSAQEFSTPIGADGTYSFDVTNLTAPFILKATGTANGQNYTLYSLASATGVANINPLSHLAVIRANGGLDPLSLYTNLTGSQLQSLKAGLTGALTEVQTLLQPILSQYNVTDANIIDIQYTINHLGIDLLFDTISFTINGSSLTLTNKSTGAVILTTPLSGNALNGQISMADIPTIATQAIGTVFVYPVSSAVLTGGTLQFKSIVKGTNNQAVTWNVIEAGGGSITSAGLYTAPSGAGNFHVVATSVNNPSKSATASVRVVQPNYVNLQSDSGDYIGGGQTYGYTNANAQITVSATGGYLSVTVKGDQEWWGNFQLPSTLTQLQPGAYSNLHRYPFYTPGLSWYGEGRGSNTLTGSFTIDNVVYVNGALNEIDLSFEQHSEDGVPALHGQIHWTAIDKTPLPGPVNPLPAGLWKAAPGSTPATGNYVYLQSDSGDYIGGGQSYSYTNANAQISVAATGGRLNVNISNNQDNWSGDFQAMSSLNQLQPGYYGSLMRYPFNNPIKGGLDWDGNGRGCNTLTGWFVVDNVNYENGVLSTADLRFEQHCEGGIPALHGQIHWSR